MLKPLSRNIWVHHMGIIGNITAIEGRYIFPSLHAPVKKNIFQEYWHVLINIVMEILVPMVLRQE